MATALKLTYQDILEKEFHIDFKGYDAQEVDHFLDLVRDDYEQMNQLIKAYEAEINQLKLKAQEWKMKAESTKANLDILKQEKYNLEEKGVRNADIINRLSKLESMVHDEPESDTDQKSKSKSKSNR